MAGEPHAPANVLRVRQTIAPRPQLPPTPNASLVVDGMTMTAAFSSSSCGMLSER
jgi:hypothetical protein